MVPWVNLACCLSVKQIKSFSELLDFIFSYARPLNLLLGRTFCRWSSSWCHINLNINRLLSKYVKMPANRSLIVYSNEVINSTIWIELWRFKSLGLYIYWWLSSQWIFFICLKVSYLNIACSFGHQLRRCFFTFNIIFFIP